MPLAAAAVLIAALERPSIFRPPFRLLDAALLACLAAIALQLVPIGPRLRLAIDPTAAVFDQAMRVGPPIDPLTAPARPLSLAPGATAWGLATGLAVLLVFWSSRSVFARGGTRVAARGIAWLGLVLGPLVIVQHATSPRMLYWRIRPLAGNAYPYGPFVNRNDLATWLIMALPLAVGYVIARVQSRHRAGEHFDLEATVDATALWLGAAICAITAGLITSLSRSGLTGAAVAGFAMIWLARGRLARRHAAWLLVVLAAIGLAATAYANVGLLATRLGDAFSEGVGGRLAIWKQTWPMVRDFWPVGVGVGAYERGMLLYPRRSALFYLNHAHNEYLQILAEGGALLAVPAAVALAAAFRQIARHLSADRTAMFWVRAGAASGLTAVLVQSIWETGLTLPANAVLFAVLAGIALHETGQRPSRRLMIVPRVERSSARIAAGVFALAAATRLLYLAIAPPGHDGVYWDLSTSLLQHGSLTAGGVTTTQYEAVYPLFLAAARWLTLDHVRLVQALQALVGAAGSVLLLRLGETLTGSPRVGLIAAGLYAIDPLLIRHAADATESTLVLTLLLAAAYGFVTARTTPRTIVAGLCFGLLFAARTMTLPIAVLATLLLVAERRLVPALVLALGALAVAAPFALRSHRLTGAFLPTRSGVNLFVGNSEYSSGLLPDYSPDILQSYADAIVAAERPDLADGTPAQQAAADELLARHAWDEMRRHPGEHALAEDPERRLLLLAAPRAVAPAAAGDAHSPWPERHVHGRRQPAAPAPRPGRLRGVVRSRARARLRRASTSGAARSAATPSSGSSLGTFVAVYVVYFPATRYRAPASFVLLFYAAVALEGWIAGAGTTGGPGRRESHA